MPLSEKSSTPIQKPVSRSALRSRCGMIYYGFLRRMTWLAMSGRFAGERRKPLAFVWFGHRTPLLRKLQGLDMQYQYNKITNLKLASEKINGIVIHPGEVFSYWKLIGKPTRKKGYLDGMILKNGQVAAGTGGGLCQLSNLIFWMALHSPLTIVERHRHGYDVFPDSNRKQPFGSGATCSYPHIDLMIRNDTGQDIQFRTWLDGEYLYGELRAGVPSALRYEIVERNHLMKSEFWGGYSRHNELYRLTFEEDNLIGEEFILSNHAIMMYAPFIGEGNDGEEPESRGEFNR